MENTAELEVWISALGKLFGHEGQVETTIKNKGSATPKITGIFCPKDRKITFEIVLRWDKEKYVPFMAMVSEGPRTRNYYPIQGNWSMN